MSKLEEITEEPPRRRFMKRISRLTLGIWAATKFSPKPVSAQRRISYLDAVLDTSKRQEWIDQVVSSRKPNYIISVEYATPDILRELREKYNFVPQKETTRFIIPFSINQNGELEPSQPHQIGNGSQSKIYLTDRAFFDIYESNSNLKKAYTKPELYAELEIIASNFITRNKFTEAQLFNQGIPKYPIELFRDSSGNINTQLYTRLIELLSKGSEYTSLLEIMSRMKLRYTSLYASSIRQRGIRDYNLLDDQKLVGNMDKNLIERLRLDFAPDKIFRRGQLIFT